MTEKKYFWLVVDPNPASGGKLRVPKVLSGKIPDDRKPDKGEHIQRLQADARARVAPEEVNQIAFESREALVEYWKVVIKRIAMKPEVPAQPNEVENAGQSMIGGSPSVSQSESFWIYEKDDTGKLKAVETEFLIDDQKLANEADFELAEKGDFPSIRLTKIAFDTKAELGRFSAAYKRGVEKKKSPK